MGKWFPGIRTGTREQAAALRAAQKDLERNGQAERAQGVRDETDRFHELNRAVSEARAPLSPVQRFWHFDRAVVELDVENARRGRQARTAARTRRTR